MCVVIKPRLCYHRDCRWTQSCGQSLGGRRQPPCRSWGAYTQVEVIDLSTPKLFSGTVKLSSDTPMLSFGIPESSALPPRSLLELREYHLVIPRCLRVPPGNICWQVTVRYSASRSVTRISSYFPCLPHGSYSCSCLDSCNIFLSMGGCLMHDTLGL